MSPAKVIASVKSWEALDSRGKPTVACRVALTDGTCAAVRAPSGASTGRYEVHELRDGGDRYAGMGVQRAVSHVNGEIASLLVGRSIEDRRDLDRELCALDGTADLSKLGGNAIVAASLAMVVVEAAAAHEPLYRYMAAHGTRPLLPLPMVNIISGGAHAGRALDIQDVLAVPIGASSFGDAIEWTSRVRSGTAEWLQSHGHDTALVADEGGLSAALSTNRDALTAVVAGIENAGLTPGLDVALAVDIAASQFVFDDHYLLRSEGRELSLDEWADEISGWCDDLPIVSLEDPCGEDDWSGWRVVSRRLGGHQILGDDIFVTDVGRLRRAIGSGIANAVLIKPNQTGTVTSAEEVVNTARAAGYATVVSARSGDTEDCWLADVVVGWRAGQLKVGSTARSERTAKWNRLLEINMELGDEAEYAGAGALASWT